MRNLKQKFIDGAPGNTLPLGDENIRKSLDLFARIIQLLMVLLKNVSNEIRTKNKYIKCKYKNVFKCRNISLHYNYVLGVTIISLNYRL